MTARPKLIFGSFKGISDVRIQTYTLKATTPLARAILIHGSRCHFAAEFLKYNPNYIVQNNSSQNPRHIDKHKNPLNKSTEPDVNILINLASVWRRFVQEGSVENGWAIGIGNRSH